MSGALGGIGLGMAASPLNMIGATTGGLLGATGLAGGVLGNLGGGFAGTGEGRLPVNMALDPTAAGIYQGALGNYQNMLNQFQGGAESPYVQAMVNPAIQANASAYGNVLQDQAARGIRGSSFGDLGIQNLINQANTNVADIRAKAMANQLGQQQGIVGGMTDIGKLYQQQGMGAMQTGAGYNEAVMRADQAAKARNAGMFGGLMGGLGGLLGGSGGGLGSLGGIFGGGSAPVDMYTSGLGGEFGV